MDEELLRKQIVDFARSLFERGFSVGTAGNISARLEDGSLLVTPTNSSLGFLEPEKLSRVDPSGRHISGDRPSKELPLHLGFYAADPQAGAVVHLHSTFATALSCLPDLDPDNCVPMLTPYMAMRVGAVRLIPYFPPGDRIAGEHVEGLGPSVTAVLLANHGTAVKGATLVDAVAAAEELEETCKLHLLVMDRSPQVLSPVAVAALSSRRS